MAAKQNIMTLQERGMLEDSIIGFFFAVSALVAELFPIKGKKLVFLL